MPVSHEQGMLTVSSRLSCPPMTGVLEFFYGAKRPGNITERFGSFSLPGYYT
jgi:hypothetical protein